MTKCITVNGATFRMVWQNGNWVGTKLVSDSNVWYQAALRSGSNTVEVHKFEGTVCVESRRFKLKETPMQAFCRLNEANLSPETKAIRNKLAAIRKRELAAAKKAQQAPRKKGGRA